MNDFFTQENFYKLLALCCTSGVTICPLTRLARRSVTCDCIFKGKPCSAITPEDWKAYHASCIAAGGLHA